MSFPARSVASLLACLCVAAAPSAHAVEPLDTFSARIGGYVSRFDTELRADGQTAAGTPIELDRDLGLDQDEVIGYIGATWRPWERHEFGLSYYRTGTSSDRRLQRDIVFDDAVYQASATVRAEYDMDAYEASYTWWAASHETWALGPRLGLVWYKVSLGIDLQLDANGNQAGTSLDREVSADLPAPTIGGSWRWTPADDWRVVADGGYFAADFNDIDADVLFGRLGVEWYPWPQWGFSLDYIISRINAETDKPRFSGDFDFVDSGMRLGVIYRF